MASAARHCLHHGVHPHPGCDAPLGFWSLGADGTFWIRFAPSAELLVLLGLGSLVMVAVMLAIEPELRRLVRWSVGNPAIGFAMALVASVIIILPLASHYRFVPIEARGGTVAPSTLVPLLVVTLCGNLYEEVLFRGFLQGYVLDRGIGAMRAALVAGTGFAVGHVFLASTVTCRRSGPGEDMASTKIFPHTCCTKDAEKGERQ